MRSLTSRTKIIFDCTIVLLSLVITVALVHNGSVVLLFHRLLQYPLLCCFIGGFFLVSIFTAAPATALLAGLALHLPPPVVAFYGACGAACGDVSLFTFLRSTIIGDIQQGIERLKAHKRYRRLFFGPGQWFITIVGVIVWLLPIPDEVALTILGVTKTRNSYFLLLSWLINFITITGISLLARSVRVAG